MLLNLQQEFNFKWKENENMKSKCSFTLTFICCDALSKRLQWKVIRTAFRVYHGNETGNTINCRIYPSDLQITPWITPTAIQLFTPTRRTPEPTPAKQIYGSFGEANSQLMAGLLHIPRAAQHPPNTATPSTVLTKTFTQATHLKRFFLLENAFSTNPTSLAALLPSNSWISLNK